MELLRRLSFLVLLAIMCSCFQLGKSFYGWVSVVASVAVFIMPLFYKKYDEEAYYSKTFTLMMDFFALALMVPFYVMFLLNPFGLNGYSIISFVGMYIFMQNSLYTTFRLEVTEKGLRYEINRKLYELPFANIDCIGFAARPFPFWLKFLAVASHVAYTDYYVNYSELSSGVARAVRVLKNDSTDFYFTISLNGKKPILKNFQIIINAFERENIKLEDKIFVEDYKITERPFFEFNKMKPVLLLIGTLISPLVLGTLGTYIFMTIGTLLGKNVDLMHFH